MDTITFCFLISLIVLEGLDMRLMDVLTVYLYASIDDIYIKILKGFKLLKENSTKSCNIYSVKLQQSLYDLK